MTDAKVGIPDLEGEVWKKIDWLDTGNRPVFVSNKGRVKWVLVTKANGVCMLQEKLYYIWLDRDGYARVKFFVNEVRVKFGVHRLVGRAFVALVEGKDQINHLDHNRSNNNAENLEWCTAAENIRHKIRRTPDPAHRQKCLTADQVAAIRQDFAQGGVSCYRLAVQHGVKNHVVAKIVTNRTYKNV